MHDTSMRFQNGTLASRESAQDAKTFVRQSYSFIRQSSAETLDSVFRERVRRTPDATAYLHFDPDVDSWVETTWAQAGREVARWQAALDGLGLRRGERVALMMGNRREWVFFDQAALGLGLVTVPLYPGDRTDNLAWVLEHAGCRALLIEGPAQWPALESIGQKLASLAAVIALEPPGGDLPNLRLVSDWLPARGDALRVGGNAEDDLATLVYTSGTTGRPKGVELSHRNILFNVRAGLQSVAVHDDDLMLSFLPLSHMLERSIGYYLPMVAGCRVAYARSVAQLAEDLTAVRPTILIAVPRIFERVHGRIRAALEESPSWRRWLFEQAVALGWGHFLRRQGRAPWSVGLLARPVLDRLVAAKVRARLGGRLRFAISGGAPLPPAIGRFFIALGVEILQGYGLTETSPVISVNRLDDNDPDSVGRPLPGVEVRIGDGDELLTRSRSVTRGYWRDPAATRALIDAEGWLHTGDQARIGLCGHLYITGRLKDILVLSTGEKVPPEDLEQALAACPLVEQVMVVGDGRPYLTALVVPDAPTLARDAAELGIGADGQWPGSHPAMIRHTLDRLSPCLSGFPGYAKLGGVALLDEPWSVENGLLTPTLKLRRRAVLERYPDVVEALYAGH